MGSRSRAAVVAAVALALAAASALVWPGGRPAGAATFNPLTGNQGFGVFVNRDAEVKGEAQNRTYIDSALAMGGDLWVGPVNVAYKVPASASTSSLGQPAGNATDPDPNTYWQGGTGSLPVTAQTLTVDLGSVTTVAVVQVRLPVGFTARTQTFSVLTSTDGTTFTQAMASATYTFAPGGDYPNANVIFLPTPVSGRYVQLSISANSAGPNGQVGSLQVYQYRPPADVTHSLAFEPSTFRPNNEKEPVGLLIGGGVNWAYGNSQSWVRVVKGYIKIGSVAGTEILTGAGTSLAPAGTFNASSNSPYVYSGGQQTAPVHQGGLIDFAAAFGTFRTRSTELAACAGNVQLTDASGAPLPPTIPAGTSARLTLQPNVQNQLTITAANLNNIRTLTFASAPNATTPLIINVDTSGIGNSFNWQLPTVSGASATAAQYMLLNFPTATAVTFNGATPFYGSIYAPRAAVTIRNSGDTNGSIIADRFVQGGRFGESGGAITIRPFSTTVTSCTPQVVTIRKTASVGSTTPGGSVTYTITVKNDGGAPVSGATFTDALSDVIDDATVQSGPTADVGTVGFTAPNITWTGNLAVGQTATITYSVQVKTPRTGNGRLVNGISSSTQGSSCPTPSASADCTTTVTVSGLTISKAASVDSALPGAVVTYTVTVTNSGQTAYTGATFTDSLADVTDDAAYRNDATATAGTVGYSAPNLTWTGDLLPTDSVTVTYSVQVNNPRTGNGRLVNAITSATAGSNCASGSTDPACTKTVTVTSLTIAKQVDASTTTPGSTVGYTVTVTNSGQTPYAAATFTDSLAGVLDDASYLGGANATTGTVSFTSPNLTWTGNLGAGASATITYSVVVRNPVPGDRVLGNAVTSSTPGNDCPTGNTNPACRTTVNVLVPALTIVKSADVTSTSPGGVVRYTVTVTNTGQTPYTGITIRDALGGVLDDATYNNDGAASDGGPVTIVSGILSWTGNIGLAGSVTITFSVTATGAGDRLLANAVTTTAPGSNCPAGGTDPRCRLAIQVLVPGLTITQTADRSPTAPGGAVGYTITIANTGQVSYAALTVTESLADVLDDATYDGNAAASAGVVSVVGSTLTWTGSLAPSAQVTITYSVTVTAAGNHRLRGTVVGDATGSNCATGSTDTRCTTDVPIAHLDVDFRALSPDGSTELTSTTPGSIVRFDLTLTNLGQVPYSQILVINDGTDGLDDSVINGDQTASSGNLVIDGTQIRWTGDIPVGGSVFITGTVTVEAVEDLGNRMIAGTTVSAAQGSNCPPGTTEDHCRIAVAVLIPALTLAKSADSPSTVSGGTVSYTITATNTGETAYTGISVQDQLDDLLDDANYNGDVAAVVTPPGPNGTLNFVGATLNWTGDLAVGARVTITYTATAKTSGRENNTLTNTVVSTASGSNCTAPDTPGCTVSVPVLVPKLTIHTTANTTSATPGTFVAYNVSIVNSGQLPYTGITVDVGLAGLLDDATYNNDASADAGTVNYAAPTLTWTGDVAVGFAVNVTFTATVDNPPLGNRSLAVVASSAAEANNCPSGGTDPLCTATVAVVDVQTLTVTKATQGGVTVAAPGQVVGYVVTMSNSAATPFEGATLTDTLVDVVDDATYNNDASQVVNPTAPGSVVYNAADSTLVWTGTVPAEGVVTITYTVTVTGTSTGNNLLLNTVTSDTPGTNCPPAAGDARCSSSVPVTEMTITYTATPATATPGQVVTFQATIRNTGNAVYPDLNIAFSSGDVTDDAEYTGNGSADSGTLTPLTGGVLWEGDLPIGATVTVLLPVRIRQPATGNKIVSSQATSNVLGSNCPQLGSDPACTATATVLVPQLTIIKSSPNTFAVPGARVPYTITITNSGQTAYTGIEVRDNIAGGLDDAVYEPAVLTGGGTLTYTAPELVWTGDLAVSDTVRITYALIVNSPDTGDKSLVDAVTSDAVGSTCPTGPPAANCRITIIVLTPELTIQKTANATTTTMGSTVQFTVTIQNTGQTPYAAAEVTDALGGVLDDATYGSASATVGSVILDGQTLRWTGDLPTGQSATVTYSVTVAVSTGDKVLNNQVSSPVAGNNCASGSTDTRCRVSVPVAILTIVHTASPAETVPTGMVLYTLTITNAGAVDYTDLVVEQDFAGVLDDATGTGARRLGTRGNVSTDGSVLTWTGDLPAGESVTIENRATVNDPATGDDTMSAVASADALGSNCPPEAPAAECVAVAAVQEPVLTVTSSVSVPSATPGDTITVTITATNDGPVTYIGGDPTLGVSLTESLIGAVDDATYNDDAVATGAAGQLSVVGDQLTWTLTGNMDPGGSVTITYSVTVDTPPAGNRVVIRRVTADALGATCAPGDLSAACASSVPILIPELTITKAPDRSSVVPEETVRYTVTIANTGQADYAAGTEVVDDLTDVLANASYLNDADTDVGTVSFAASLLTWTGALPVGTTATVLYSVRVDQDAGGQALTNVVTSDAAGANCPVGGSDPRCTATVTVLRQVMNIDKAANLSTVVVGGTVQYSIVVTNDGEAPYTGVTVEDSLAAVLDAGDYEGNANATTGEVNYIEPTLTWTGDLEVGATVVITYSVRATGGGDNVLSNVVTSAANGSTCLAANRAASCFTTTPVEAATITISGLTTGFTLSGAPMETSSVDSAVSLTVTTNSPTGYTVGVSARGSALLPPVGNPDTIPVSNLHVRRTGDTTYQSLVDGAQVLVHVQSGPSQAGGDVLSNDYQVDIPFVRPDNYTITLDYVAITQ